MRVVLRLGRRGEWFCDRRRWNCNCGRVSGVHPPANPPEQRGSGNRLARELRAKVYLVRYLCSRGVLAKEGVNVKDCAILPIVIPFFFVSFRGVFMERAILVVVIRHHGLWDGRKLIVVRYGPIYVNGKPIGGKVFHVTTCVPI